MILEYKMEVGYSKITVAFQDEHQSKKWHVGHNFGPIILKYLNCQALGGIYLTS